MKHRSMQMNGTLSLCDAATHALPLARMAHHGTTKENTACGGVVKFLPHNIGPNIGIPLPSIVA